MDIEFKCKKCNQNMVIDSAGAGMSVECPNCKDILIVPAIKPEIKSTIEVSNKTKECPFCGEQIFAVAKKCKHCGETIDVVLRTAEEAMRANSKQNINVNQNVAPQIPVVVKEKTGCVTMIGWFFLIMIIISVISAIASK